MKRTFSNSIVGGAFACQRGLLVDEAPPSPERRLHVSAGRTPAAEAAAAALDGLWIRTATPARNAETITAAHRGQRKRKRELAFVCRGLEYAVQGASLRGRYSPPATLAHEGKIEQRMRSGQRFMIDC